MSSGNSVDELLLELKTAIYVAFPGIEKQLLNAFKSTDVVGDDMLPYNVVEALLRHFLMKCGLVEYIARFSNESGCLSLDHLKNVLKGSSLEDLRDDLPDRMMSCNEMTTLAIIWLKIISDDYQAESNPEIGFTATCGIACSNPDMIKGNIDEDAAFIMRNESLRGSNVHDQIDTANDSIKNQTLSKSVENATLVDVSNAKSDCEVVNGSVKEEATVADGNVRMGDRPEYMDMYIKSIFDHIEANKIKGVKCFAYPAAITPNGACASAGAMIPQRRRRPVRKNKERPLLGCC